MTLPVVSPSWGEFARSALSARVLGAAAALFLAAALVGQWAFAWYIANFYGGALASGHYERWAALTQMGAVAYVPGDTAGNRFFGAHALAAGLIALGGALQFIPWVRNGFPVFHRWNGRLFVLTVTALSLTGFWLVWVRHSSPSPLNAISTSINGVLILGFALMTWRTALARRFDVHPRWALRLYLVSNAQWFLRIGLFGYFVANMAVGRKPHASDPFMLLWTPGCYLVPLAVSEIYLRVRDDGGGPARLATAALLLVLTLAMAVGAFAFFMFSQRILSGAPLKL